MDRRRATTTDPLAPRMDPVAGSGRGGLGATLVDLAVGAAAGSVVNVVGVAVVAALAAGLMFTFPGRMHLPDAAFFSAVMSVLPVGCYGWAWLLPLAVLLRRRPGRVVGVLLVGLPNTLLTLFACGGVGAA